MKRFLLSFYLIVAVLSVSAQCWQQVSAGLDHTLAIKPDGTLWGWGSDDGPAPRVLMEQVDTMAAGDTDTVALLRNGTLWQWKVGARPSQLLLNR